LEAGVKVVEDMGLVPWVMESCYVRHEFLAGADEIRLRDLHMAFAEPKVQGIFVARGGYGAGRLLPGIDFDLIRRNPKVFAGYSDVTALHVVFNQRCGLVTFHGPMVASDFGRGVDGDTLEWFKQMVFVENASHRHCGLAPGRMGEPQTCSLFATSPQSHLYMVYQEGVGLRVGARNDDGVHRTIIPGHTFGPSLP